MMSRELPSCLRAFRLCPVVDGVLIQSSQRWGHETGHRSRTWTCLNLDSNRSVERLVCTELVSNVPW